MRAKDVCLTVGVDPAPKHVEGARARLKRMVSRGILTENEPEYSHSSRSGPNLPYRPQDDRDLGVSLRVGVVPGPIFGR
jgi:hypothetical protein